MSTTSGTLGSYIYGYLSTPTVRFFEWDVTEVVSPSGYRNVPSGIPSFVKEVSASGSIPMEFEDTVVNFDNLQETYSARVQCFSFVNSSTQYLISNMRFWMPGSGALENANLEYTASGTWHYNAILPSGYGLEIPNTLPTSQNIKNQDDVTLYMAGALDKDVSQFIYLGLTIPSGHELGRFGSGGSGSLTFRITYDWYNILVPSTE